MQLSSAHLQMKQDTHFEHSFLPIWWKLGDYHHRVLHNTHSSPWLERYGVLQSKNSTRTLIKCHSLLFLPDKRCQLPTFVLCSLGHTAVSPSPGLLLSSVLSRSTHLSFSEGVLQVVFSDSRNRHCFCCTHWIDCWAVQTSKPFSSLTCQSNILWLR